MKPVVNVHEAEAMDVAGGDGEKFAARCALVGARVGSFGPGAKYVAVEPGKGFWNAHRNRIEWADVVFNDWEGAL